MADVVVAAVVIFLAELGDKTQLVVLTAGSRHRTTSVLAALAVAIAILEALAVTVGGALDRLLPDDLVTLGAGLLFLAFAVITWRDRDGDDDELGATGRASLLGLVTAFVVAELGDKTMLGTASLAASRNPVAVWIGATIGFWAVTALAVFAGAWLARRVHPRTLTRVGAAAFAAVGVATLLSLAW